MCRLLSGRPALLTGHPSSGPAGAKGADEAQPAAAHREVAHQVPDQRGQLHEPRKQREDRALELD